MFRLTREVRFAINELPDAQLDQRPANSYGGYPSLTGLGPFLTLRVTLAGALDPVSQYIINIKEMDELVRDQFKLLTNIREPHGLLKFFWNAIQKRLADRLSEV